MVRRPQLVLPLVLALLAAGCLQASGPADGGVSPSDADLPGPDVDVASCLAGDHEAAFHEDAEVETWRADVPADVRNASVDVRSYGGGVLVQPWDRAEVRVQVAEVDPDDEIEPHVDLGTANGTLRVHVRVAWNGSGLMDLVDVDPDEPDAFAQVMVRVPDVRVREVLLADVPEDGTRSGVLRVYGNQAAAHWDALEVRDLRVDGLGVGAEHADVRLRSVDALAVDVGASQGDVLAHGLRTVNATLSTDLGDVCASRAEADVLALHGPEGDLGAAGVDAAELRLLGGDAGDVLVEAATVDELDVEAGRDAELRAVNATEARLRAPDGALRVDGGRVLELEATAGFDVRLEGVEVGTVDVRSDHGSVAAELVPVRDGSIDVTAPDQGADVRFPADPGVGLDVRAASHRGNVTVDLRNATTTGTSSGPDGTVVEARTRGFAQREVQVQVDVASTDGDVLVEG